MALQGDFVQPGQVLAQNSAMVAAVIEPTRTSASSPAPTTTKSA
jgi:hypothetical protein